MLYAVKGKSERPIAYFQINNSPRTIKVFGRSAPNTEEIRDGIVSIDQSEIASIVNAPFAKDLSLSSVNLAISVLNRIVAQYLLYAYTVCEISYV